MKHKHAELIKAWADGAQIQTLDIDNWFDVDRPNWDEGITYRIKPKEKKPVVRWLWARYDADKEWHLYGRLMTEEEASIMISGLSQYKCLDWSRTEFKE